MALQHGFQCIQTVNPLENSKQTKSKAKPSTQANPAPDQQAKPSKQGKPLQQSHKNSKRQAKQTQHLGKQAKNDRQSLPLVSDTKKAKQTQQG
jgi:hypothetical protein